jgi:nitrous oxidase accessory protein
MLEVLDFLERLAPFSEPDVIVRDDAPLMVASAMVASAEPAAAERPEGDVQAQDRNADEGRPAAPSAYEILKQSLGRQ